jgi:GR25 family glycosyltransferase involved in LPS biosynthesis
MRAHIFGLLLCVVAVGCTAAIPVYWINLDFMKERRDSMTTHLNEVGFQNHKRITALTPQTCNLIMVDSNCNRVSTADVSIACSHVSAMHTALHDQAEAAKASKYFLVLEDDVRFKFKVDVEKLIASAPDDFGALQLMMSHKLQIEGAWNHYLWSLNDSKDGHKRADYFIHRPRNSTVWSAQAVIYNKDIIRPFIERAVVADRNGLLGYKLVTSADYEKTNPAKINAYKPVIACACLFADMFVYAMAQPAYVLTVPFLNSAAQGVNSSYHQSHVVYHLQGFAKAQQIQNELAEDPALLPPFLTPLKAAQKETEQQLRGSPHSPAEKAVDWVDVAKRNPAHGHGVPKRFNNE